MILFKLLCHSTSLQLIVNHCLTATGWFESPWKRISCSQKEVSICICGNYFCVYCIYMSSMESCSLSQSGRVVHMFWSGQHFNWSRQCNFLSYSRNCPQKLRINVYSLNSVTGSGHVNYKKPKDRRTNLNVAFHRRCLYEVHTARVQFALINVFLVSTPPPSNVARWCRIPVS